MATDWSVTLFDDEADGEGFERFHTWKDASGQMPSFRLSYPRGYVLLTEAIWGCFQGNRSAQESGKG